MTSSVDTLSSAPVGSSARIIAGSLTSARAIATRCCWPPESSLGMCPARVRQPDLRSSAARARRRPVALARVDQRQLDVALRGGAGQQVERLEDEADLAVADARRAGCRSGRRRRLAVEPVAAAGRGVQAAEDVHHRRLARPRVTHDRDHLALVDVQRHAVEGAHLDRRRCCRPCETCRARASVTAARTLPRSRPFVQTWGRRPATIGDDLRLNVPRPGGGWR